MSPLAGTLLLWLPLLAWGAHAWIPWAAAEEERWRAPWRAASIPLALAAGLALLARFAAQPDLALAAAVAPAFVPRGTALLLLVATATALAADLLLAAGGERLSASTWRLGAFAGLLALVAYAIAAERLRTAFLPPAGPLSALAGPLATAALALATAQAFSGPRRATAVAGLLLPLHLLPLPARLLDLDAAGGQILTLGAASALLLAAPWVPDRLRRPAALAGSLLAALFLAGTERLAASLPLLPVLAP
ncbi:MAG: hypothetical protein KJ058_16420 [Thermoanaerobaculia bacterium]|nr:hypothetical protein [Thermoanaerobaculia bacterium]